MANPSTVNPTASGKEVLRRAFYDGTGETERTLLTVASDHIVTVLSLIILERANISDSKFNLSVLPDGGSALYLFIGHPISNENTFMINDKFVLTGGDVLKLVITSASATATADVWLSYIDQDFS